MTTMLAASTGGHLLELHELAQRTAAIGERSLWVTHDNEQSRSLLEGLDCVFLDPMPQRDVATVVQAWPEVHRLIDEHRVERVISTGAAISLAVIPVALRHGIQCHYIESATRVHDIALSGRVLGLMPGVQRYHQFAATSTRYRRRGWQYGGSVFDGYRAVATGDPSVRRMVVTVGTQANYGFRRLLDRLVEIIPSGVEVLWQTGSTDVSGLPIEARPRVGHHELTQAFADADAVVAHCGVGSALACFREGRRPVLVPRRRSQAEHVDDHQVHLGRYLEGRGLAEIAPDLDELRWDQIVATAGYRIERDPPPAFVLKQSKGLQRLVGAQGRRVLGWGSAEEFRGGPGLGRPGRGNLGETGPLV